MRKQIETVLCFSTLRLTCLLDDTYNAPTLTSISEQVMPCVIPLGIDACCPFSAAPAVGYRHSLPGSPPGPVSCALMHAMLQPMGDESSTAQVHPQKLSRALMEAAQEKGAELRIGQVQGVNTTHGAVTGRCSALNGGWPSLMQLGTSTQRHVMLSCARLCLCGVGHKDWGPQQAEDRCVRSPQSDKQDARSRTQALNRVLLCKPGC